MGLERRRMVLRQKLDSVLVVDDHRLLRDMLATGIEGMMPGVRVDAVKDLDSALEMLQRRPSTDIVLLDYKLPDSHGTSGIRDVRRAARHAKIIVMSAYINHSMLSEIEDAGADGALTKDISMAELANRLRDAANDVRHFCAPEMNTSNEELTERFGLSPRELEAWTHLASGQRNVVIATRMGISESTVKVHLHNLFKKIGVHSRVEAYEFWRNCTGNSDA